MFSPFTTISNAFMRLIIALRVSFGIATRVVHKLARMAEDLYYLGLGLGQFTWSYRIKGNNCRYLHASTQKGGGLPNFYIFKRRRCRRNYLCKTNEPGATMAVQAKAWMTKHIFKAWINHFIKSIGELSPLLLPIGIYL